MLLVLFFMLVLAIIAITYFLPPPHHDFFELYPENDVFAQKLKEFRTRPLKKIELNGESWFYYSGGKGTKTLLFIHGMGGAYDIWWNQIIAFENQFKTIAFTLPQKVNTLEKAEKGILKILQAEKIQQFSVIGTSMGGYIAQYLTQHHPERIEQAIFGNTFPPNDLLLNKNRTKRKMIPFLPEILLYWLSKKNLINVILPAAQNNALLYAVLQGLPFNKKQFINRLDIVLQPFPIPVKNNSVPLLIFESDNDPLIPKTLREQLKHLYPDAKVHTFHQQGHFPYLNAASEYNQVLNHFLNDFQSSN